MEFNQTIKLVLEDGSEFSGKAFGYPASTAGEVVFNTGMVGYPETLTDPSYCGQILVFTFPLIGNYGVPGKIRENDLLKYFESEHIRLKGIIVSQYSHEYSHWSAARSLHDWLYEEKIPGIFGLDTRQITRKLREYGTMSGKIVIEDNDVPFFDYNNYNFVKDVSIQEPVIYKKGSKKVVLVDCGTKNNIIQAFLGRDITVKRVPYDYDFSSENVSGIVLSNGPGDPKMCDVTIQNTRKVMERGLPILGICLGSQILALAAGADTYKLKYGHRSHNQPVNESGTKRCYISSQNHGYAINSETLPEDWREWFINDNDGTNEGIIHIAKPFFGAQFHPEASPGPDDTEFIFDIFVRSLR